MVERTPTGWRGCYRDPDGRKRPRTFPNKTTARTWTTEHAALVSSRRWRDPNAGKATVGEYERQWSAHRVVEATTAANDRSRLDRHVLPEWCDKPVGLLRPSQVQGWVKRLTGTGMAPATVAACHGLLRGLLEAARRDGLIEANPAAGVNLPTVPEGLEVFLTRADVDAVADRMDDFNRAVLYTLALTGMRWGEVAGLSAHRLHLLASRIDVVDVLTEVGGDRQVKNYPKGKRRRSIPVPADLRAVLAEHLAAHPATGAELLFRPRPVGALCRHTWGRDIWHPAREAAGVRRARVHDLRHSYASCLVQDGVDLYRVMRLLGHQSVTTTQRYTHLVPDSHDRVLEALDGTTIRGKQGANLATMPPHEHPCGQGRSAGFTLRSAMFGHLPACAPMRATGLSRR